MIQTLYAVFVLAAVVIGCYFVGRWIDRHEARRSVGTDDEHGWFPTSADARLLRKARRELETSRRQARTIAALSAIHRD